MNSGECSDRGDRRDRGDRSDSCDRGRTSDTHNGSDLSKASRGLDRPNQLKTDADKASSHPHSLSSVEAAEAGFEGAFGAALLTPTSLSPVLGGELLITPQDLVDRAEDDLDSSSIRSGLRSAGPLAIAGVVTNGANVIVTVLLARLLATQSYGALNQLTGLFLIVSMPGSAVIVSVVRSVTSMSSSHSSMQIRHWGTRLHRQGSIALLIFAIISFGLRNWFSHTLGQHDGVGSFAILTAAGLWILLSVDRGLLQANRGYRSLAMNLIVEGGVKTVAMILFVIWGFSTTGGALGILLAEFAAVIHCRRASDRSWRKGSFLFDDETCQPERGVANRHTLAVTCKRWMTSWVSALKRDRRIMVKSPSRRSLILDLSTAVVSLSMVAWLQNIDVIVVGRDNPALSGSYAAVSVSSKVLVFGAILLGGYLLPEASIRWHRGGHALRQLWAVLLILAVPAIFLLALAGFAPRLLLDVVFHGRYLGAAPAFAPLVLAMVCLSITVVLSMYLLAIGRRWIAPLLIVGAFASTLAMIRAHGIALSTAQADLAVQATLALVVILGFIQLHHRRSK